MARGGSRLCKHARAHIMLWTGSTQRMLVCTIQPGQCCTWTLLCQQVFFFCTVVLLMKNFEAMLGVSASRGVAAVLALVRLVCLHYDATTSLFRNRCFLHSVSFHQPGIWMPVLFSFPRKGCYISFLFSLALLCMCACVLHNVYILFLLHNSRREKVWCK